MLNRKMKLIWKEEGTWLTSAPQCFLPFPQQRQWAVPGEMGMFPLEPDLLHSMHWNRTSAFIGFKLVRLIEEFVQGSGTAEHTRRLARKGKH